MKKKTDQPEEVKARMSDQTNQAFADAMKAAGGYGEMEGEIIGTVAIIFRDLLLANWPQVKKIRSNAEDSAVSMSFGFEVDTSGKQPLVKGKLSFSEKFTDSAEAWVDDPEQTKLALNN